MKTFSNGQEKKDWQLATLNRLFQEILPGNAFYREKYKKFGLDTAIQFSNLDAFFDTIPFTTKGELAADQQAFPPYGTNLTYPLEKYTRYSQTSGTSGEPIRWLDTSESWQWLLENWKIILRMSGVKSGDRIFFAFSFGPFLGFWTAFEAGQQLGCLCMPGGGLSSLGRLSAIIENQATVLCCTPTYAVRLGQIAEQEKIDLAQAKVRAIIVAGEPGGSIPEIYQKIETLWPGAKVYDHHGMTEVGPVSYECLEKRGRIRIIESAYLAEIIDPESGISVPEGETGELVLTVLGRAASPLIRYRTNDLVKAVPQTEAASGQDLALEGGVLGRVDDMLTIRGVNIYPAAIEKIIRAVEGIAEYRVEVFSQQGMEEMRISLEPDDKNPNPKQTVAFLEKRFRELLAIRIPVTLALPGTLPRFELKAKRWVRY